jgi:hypothetical protein
MSILLLTYDLIINCNITKYMKSQSAIMIITLALLLSATVLPANAAEPTLDVVWGVDTAAVYVVNPTVGWITCSYTINPDPGVVVDTGTLIQASFGPFSRTKLVEASGNPLGFTHWWVWCYGRLGPTTDTYVYNLPWTPGQTYYTAYAPEHNPRTAIDWGMPESTVLRAARSGVVVEVHDSWYATGDTMPANGVVIMHNNGMTTGYWHNVQGGALVTVGQIVNAGDPIALSGNTGPSSGPHLHFDRVRATESGVIQSFEISLRTAETGAFTPPVPGWYTAVAAQDIETFAYAPVAFSLHGPAYNTETSSALVRFSWGDATCTPISPIRYRLQFSQDSTFSAVTTDSFWITDTAANATPPGNDTWYWRVVAADSALHTLVSTQTWWLLWDTGGPSAPTLLSPIGGETSYSPVALDWDTSTDTVSGFFRYRLQIDTDGTFSGTMIADSYQTSPDTVVALSTGTYHWRVIAYDRLDNSTTAGPESFAVVTQPETAPPGPFSLLVPLDGTCTRTTEIVFRWGDATDSTPPVTYRVQACTSLAFVNMALDTSWLATTTCTASLPANETYYWRVIARDSHGNSRNSTETWSLVVDTMGPSIPVMVAPIGDSLTSPVSFDWNPSTDSLSGMQGYRIQIDTSGAFAGSMAVDSFQVAPDTSMVLSANTYWWRVVAYDNAGCSTASVAETFIVYVPPETAPPTPFSLTAPTAGTETTATSVTFRWVTSSDSSPPVTYRLEVCTTAAFANLATETSWISETSATIPVPANDSYYWRVIARDAHNNQRHSTETWTLIVDTAGPSAPIIVAPKNGDTRVSPVLLDWNASSDSLSGVNRYRVQIDTAGTFVGTLTVDSYQASPDTTIALAADTYWWRVIAYDNVGNATAVPPESFLVVIPVDTTPPSVFSLTSPADNLETTAVTHLFRWEAAQDSSGPVAYRLQVSTTAGFGVMTIDTSWLVEIFCAAVLPANSRYYWRVFARDAFNNLRQSTETWSLVVDTAGPGVPALTLHGGAGETSPISFQWSVVTDSLVAFRNYRLQVSNSIGFGSYVIDSYTMATDSTAMLQIDTYWWRVVAYDTLGNSTTSAVDSFRVVAFSESNAPIIYSVEASPTSVRNTGTDTIVFSIQTRDSSAITGVILKKSLLFDTIALTLVTDSLYRTTVTVASSVSAATYTCVLRVTDAFENVSETTVAVTIVNAAPSFAMITNLGTDSVALFGDYISVLFDTSTIITQVLYEYRSQAVGGAWSSCTVASFSPPNPSAKGIVWDLQGLPVDVYELRGVGKKPSGETDSYAAVVLVNRLVGAPGASILTSYASGIYSETHIFRGGVADSRALFDGTLVATPAGAFADSAYICLARYTSAPPEAPAPAGGLLVPGVGVYRRFDYASGAPFGSAVTVTLPFNDTGLSTAQKNSLALYTYDEVARQWMRVSGSTVDSANNVVRASVGHFSFFAIFIAGNATNLQGVSIYPNPFVPYDGNPDNGVPYSPGNANSGVMFTNLPANVSVDVYTVSGARVTTLHTNAAGTWQWDVRGDDNRELASGVYLIVFRSGGETIVKKLMVIR